MYRVPPPSNLEAYEYNPQAAEDHDDDDNVRTQKTLTPKRNKKTTYRPTPLTWPFLLALIIVFLAAIGLVVYARQNRNTNYDEAKIYDRDLRIVAIVPRHKVELGYHNHLAGRQDDNFSDTATSAEEATTSFIATPTPTRTMPAEVTNMDFVETGTEAERQTVTTMLPSSEGDGKDGARIGEADSEFVVTTYTKTLCGTDDFCTLIEVVETFTEIERTSTHSKSTMSESENLFTGTSTPIHTASTVIMTVTTHTVVNSTTVSTISSDKTLTKVHTITSIYPTTTYTVHPTSHHSFTFANTTGISTESLPISETTGYSTTESESTEYFTQTVDDETTIVTQITLPSTITYTTTIPVADYTLTTSVGFPPPTSTSERVYIITGATTLTSAIKTIPRSVVTDPIEEIRPVTISMSNEEFVTVVQPEATTIVTEEGGFVSQVILTEETITYVTSVEGGLQEMVVEKTLAAGVAVTQVMTTEVGGYLTTYVQEFSAHTVVSMIGGEVQTILNSPEPETITSLVGGMIVTVPTGTSVNAQGKTVTLYAESLSGGTMTTWVTQLPPETHVITTGGRPVTFITTPEVQTITTIISGTPNVITSVFTPSEEVISSWTITTSRSGYLTTIISTPSVTSYETTISGTPTTIVSTPSPTTLTSTKSGTTYTTHSTTTTTPIPTPDQEVEVVVVSTVVEGFTAAEYFVGKFLPALYAAVLAIVLRIIDINAKFYQPFHALADPKGAFGADSLNLQYSGPKGFVTPVVTLAQGHPIPFITTLMVLLSSFIVPLSSEAIGIKLTGECSRVAIENCGGYLGASPTISLILIALLSLIIILMLLLVLFLRRYTTGVYSNPWSIAGIACLATNPELRIDDGMGCQVKSSLAEKRFSLGTYENSRGQDDYGVIFMDESERQLTQNSETSDQDDAHSDDGVTDAGGETNPATGNKRHHMPFMPLTLWWRVLFMFIMLTMFGLCLYYHLTATKRNPFRDWIQQQGFGVRFLFAGVGVVVAMSFFAFFKSKRAAQEKFSFVLN